MSPRAWVRRLLATLNSDDSIGTEALEDDEAWAEAERRVQAGEMGESLFVSGAYWGARRAGGDRS